MQQHNCAKITFCSYTMVLVLWSRHSGQYQPNQPSLTLLQCRSGGRKNGPPPFPPTQKHDHKRKREQRKGGKKKLSYSIFETATRVCGRAGGEGRKLFTTPWSLPLSFPACKSLLLSPPSFLTMYLTGKEKGRRGGVWKLGIKEGGGGFASGAAMAGKGSPLDTDSPIKSFFKKSRKQMHCLPYKLLALQPLFNYLENKLANFQGNCPSG